MHITRLALSNWKNFKSASVELERRSFFVGPNASGKSNLLDAIRFLRELSSDGLGLQRAVEGRGSVKNIRCLSATGKAEVGLSIDLGTSTSPVLWTYELRFVQSNNRARVAREIVRKSGKRKPLVDRPDKSDDVDADRLSQTALEQISANAKFREISDFLSGVSYLHVVPQIMRDRSRVSSLHVEHGSDLIDRMASVPQRTLNARLKVMEQALRAAVPQLSELNLERDDQGVPHLRAKYKHWRQQGAWQRDVLFSDGTLRLLGLIWSLQERGGPLLLEEPELSLNDGVVMQLAPMIARATRNSARQSIVTTHSSALLSNNVSLDEIHLLTVCKQGTTIVRAADLDDVKALVAGGLPAGEAVIPKVRSIDANQLSLLDIVS